MFNVGAMGNKSPNHFCLKLEILTLQLPFDHILYKYVIKSNLNTGNPAKNIILLIPCLIRALGEPLRELGTWRVK